MNNLQAPVGQPKEINCKSVEYYQETIKILENELKLADDKIKEIRSLVAGGMCGRPALEYINYQFPASEGCIPLKEWLTELKNLVK